MVHVEMDVTEKKFIIVPGDNPQEPQMIFLADYVFWARHESELQSWCTLHLSNFMGMTVTVPNEQTLSMFILKWS